LTKTGELKLFLNKNNKLKLSLNEVKNLSDGYTCREFLDISFDSIKFNELRIKNNKLTIKNKLISKNAYSFEPNSTNLQELIDIHQCLMTFKEIYYPELSVKEEIKPINKNENSNVAAFLAVNNQQEQKVI
jgi:ABC-type phosphate transport system auxiliary subunit